MENTISKIALRATLEIRHNNIVNLGVGIPIYIPKFIKK